MIKIILFLMATVGATEILTVSKLLKPIRESRLFFPDKVRELLHCQMCSGFWIGLIFGAIMFGINFNVILYGFSGSFVAWLSHNVNVKLNGEEYGE